jgi:excinuclease ABC subunit A
MVFQPARRTRVAKDRHKTLCWSKQTLWSRRMSELHHIAVRGAEEHNLKKVDLDIPKKQLVVFTGPSGSGKSSMAFDTIYAEGQRRYVESLSAYARQFLGQLEKPKYESIRGLSPTIAIEQKSASKNPRSTVGTITEILDYLRVLWARIGIQHCHRCGREVGKRSQDEIVDAICKLPENSRILLLAPKISDRKGEHQDLLDRARKAGFARVRIDGKEVALDQPQQSAGLNKKVKHKIDLVVDRLVIKDGIRQRLADSVETALREGEGKMMVGFAENPGDVRKSGGPEVRKPDGDSTAKKSSGARAKANIEATDAGDKGLPDSRTSGPPDLFFSEHLYCPHCDLSYPDLEPNSFSFNSPVGACAGCNGLGVKTAVDLGKLIQPDLSINAGAVAAWGALGDEERQAWHVEYRRELLDKLKIDLDKPWKQLPEKQRELVLHGTAERVAVNWATTNSSGTFNTKFDGVVPWLERTLKESDSDWRRDKLGQFFSSTPCTECGGSRMKPGSAAVKLGGRSLPETCALTIGEASAFFDGLRLGPSAAKIASGVLKEVQARLKFLINVGLDYLTLDRSGPTLSGGEAQRIRLASQIGSELTGVLYVLDEPSIGLHQRDNTRLIETLRHLRDIGNTVVVVEHDEDTIRAADHVVDFGPGAGELGGTVVYSGPVEGVEGAENSITGDYLSGRKAIAVPARRRAGSGKRLVVEGARANNLKNLTIGVPLGTLTCITGVSGAGKSSFLNHILYPALNNHFNDGSEEVGEHKRITGLEHLDKVIAIDQQPIGRTPRSNPATYTKVWDHIRTIFAETRESKLFGYTPSRFSFNVKGGRCEACEGDGVKKVEMHFLADVYVPCEVCHGKRFNEQTMRVAYKHKNISDVLGMSVREAIQHFSVHTPVERVLQTMVDVGLDYIRLGQPATTLSGGEAQRIKLSRELAKRGTGNTLYILDEPSTGLHFEDVRKLLDVLDRLVQAGNTVIVIEHNLDIIKTADWIVDLGPEGGHRGGQLVAEGTPEQVAKVKGSYTGQFLRPMLAKAGRQAT